MYATRRRVLALTLLGLAAVAGGGCGGKPSGGGSGGGRFTTSGKLRVVATYSVLGDLVTNVAGDAAEVVTLVGPDGDAHTFDPSPQDGMAVADCAVVFENGVGFETWLDKLHSSSGSKAVRVVVSKGLEFREGECHHGPKEKHEPGHAHEDDPHVWHDVKNAVHMVAVIRDRLCEIDPSHADNYRANAAAYLAKLEALHTWVEKTVGTLPPDRRKLVTNHDTFGYFADRYGFQVAGTALQSVSTEAGDPSAAEFAKLVEAVKAAKVPAIFAENVHNAKLMERLAAEAGVKLAPPLYTDALGPPGGGGDTYETMVRHNVITIVAALKP